MKIEDEKNQLAQMTTGELETYGRICKMSQGMISTDPERWIRHGKIVNEILVNRVK
jgi:hypothetical protein